MLTNDTNGSGLKTSIAKLVKLQSAKRGYACDYSAETVATMSHAENLINT
jgi:hypothetical protein